MNKKQKFEILEEKNRIAELGGGEERIKAQHEKGKMTARERIEMLLDPGSFVETDKFVVHRTEAFGMGKKKILGDGVVTGYGTIDGRKVCIFAQDFTVFGGALGEMHAEKILKIMDFAMKNGLPIIGLNDSGGARIQEGVASLAGYGRIFRANVIASGIVPQISVIMGPCAGGAVYSPALTDFIVMVDETSYMFITGPNVVKEVTGEDISFEDLGGSITHNRKSGVAHFRAKNEATALAYVKKLLEYIPQNNLSDPPRSEPVSPRSDPMELREVLPDNVNKPFDVTEIIIRVVDENSFFEIQKEYAQNIVIGFARLDGYPVGIVANQPKHMAGTLDINASDKAARFIRFCDSFNIPIVTFVDVPGFLPGSDQEFGGIIRHGAKLLYAYCEATVPKLTIILRKDFGGAYDVLGSRHSGADQVYAWPTAEIAVMGASGAANIIFRKEISKAENPEKKRKEMIDLYEEQFSNPYIAAELGLIDGVIFPEETRDILIKALNFTLSKREHIPPKKHANMPM